MPDVVYLPNPGHLPFDCTIFDEDGQEIGFRQVHVRTFGTPKTQPYDSKKAGHAPWPSAGGRPPTNWKVSNPPHAFEIKEYEVA